MSETAKKVAVYDDLHDVPENMIGEIIAGKKDFPNHRKPILLRLNLIGSAKCFLRKLFKGIG
jgi:hypothetical protein